MSNAKNPMPATPERLADRYRVDSTLGQGGMGAVHAVLDEQTGKTVALKTLVLPEDPQLCRRLGDMFRREYRTLRQLAHPSVIEVYDYGVSALGPYYTMELLGGDDLGRLAPLPWRRACAYLLDVCSGLALLHSRQLVHRDVSPRNVRCVDGRAKLIDFGAMVSMGAAHAIVGTAPLVPPEALDGRALDGRSDLYALGATLYCALTGTHAFPARELKLLPHFWEHAPPVPSASCADIPPELDALVMRLMAQDMEARPRSAAEVMERLAAIAGLAHTEHTQVLSAYLATPSLVGRERELTALQQRFHDLATTGSSMCVITGEQGVGRSRMLDAATVEARLEGVTVIRVQGRDVPESSGAIAEVLLQRIAEASGTSMKWPDAADLDGPTAHVRQALRSLAARNPVVVAVDDVGALDHYAQTLLATLHRSAKRRILALYAVDSAETLAPALQDRILEATRVPLQPLSGEQLELLLESVFGCVPGLAAAAAHIHGRSHGNPGAALELAQYLIDSGVARYDMGRWTLPTKLLRGDLPAAWAEALEMRLTKLDPEALALAELLAFAVDWTRSPTELASLIREQGDGELALDDLVSSNLFRVDGGRYGFATDALSQCLQVRVDGDRRATIHRKLATWLRSHEHDAIEVAQCEMRGLQPDRAIDTLLCELADGTRWDTAPAGYADTLVGAMDACVQLKRPRRDRFKLLMELIRVGEQTGVPNMSAHFAEALAQLRVDGVLQAYEQLPDALDPEERLGQAFQVTQARYDGLPENERVLTPVEGIESLAKVARQAGAFAAITVDYALLESLPSLQPLAGLSPAIASAVTGTMPGCFHVVAARYEQACECYESTLQRLSQPDHAGLDDDYWRWACNALHYVLGILYGGLGIEVALDHALHLEQDADWAVPAWDVRRGYALRLGHQPLAESCRTRMERAVLERGRPAPIANGSARTELYAVAHAGDLPGVRLAVERIEAQMGIHPGYIPYRSYGAAIIDLLCGRYAEALGKAEEALGMVQPGKHDSWPWTAGCLLEALLGLGRNAEARQRGRQLVEDAERIGLGIMSGYIRIPLAYAEVREGHSEEGVALIEDVLARFDALQCRGLNSGWAYEHRARIALEMGDLEAFSAAAARCAKEYGRGSSGGSLVARYERLRTDARRRGVATPSMLPPTAVQDFDSALASASSFLQAATATERQHNALELLLKRTGAVAGQLFLAVGDELQHCLSERAADAPSPEEFEALEAIGPLAGMGTEDVELDNTSTAFAGAIGSLDDEFVTATAFEEPTRRWVTMPLGSRAPDGQLVRAGMAVLCLLGPASHVPLDLVVTIAHALRADPPPEGS